MENIKQGDWIRHTKVKGIKKKVKGILHLMTVERVSEVTLSLALRR